MRIRSVLSGMMALALVVKVWAGAPVAKGPADILKVPDPKSIVLRPASVSADAKTPLLVYLHCKTSSPAESEPVLASLVEAWKVSLLMPCGSIKMGVKEGVGPVYDWNGAVDEERVVEAIREVKGVSPKSVFLIGFSAGGFMAYQVALKHPELFRGVIILSADIPRKSLDDAAVAGASPKVPFYVVNGTKDPNFPLSRAQGAVDYLGQHGFPATLVTHEGGHFFPDDLFGTIKNGIEWFGSEPKSPVVEPKGPLILRPAGLGKSKKTAAIVFLHGWGSSPEEVEPVFAPLVEAWNCTVVYPRGGTRLGVFPSGKVAYNWRGEEDVEPVLKVVRGLEGVDPKRVFLAGFSSGAAMCYRLGFQAPGVFAGIIPFSGSIPGEYLKASAPALTHAVPFYIVHGSQDKAVKPTAAMESEAYLKRGRIPVKVHLYDGGHYFPEDVFDVVKEAIDWFDTKQ